MLREVDPSEEAGVWTLCYRSLVIFMSFKPVSRWLFRSCSMAENSMGWRRFFVVGFLTFFDRSRSNKAAVENVPEMALKFCLGMFAIRASSSCRETLTVTPGQVSIRSCQSHSTVTGHRSSSRSGGTCSISC